MERSQFALIELTNGTNRGGSSRTGLLYAEKGQVRLVSAKCVLRGRQHFLCKPHAEPLTSQVGDHAALIFHVFLGESDLLSRGCHFAHMLRQVLLLEYGRRRIGH